MARERHMFLISGISCRLECQYSYRLLMRLWLRRDPDVARERHCFENSTALRFSRVMPGGP